MPHRSPLRRSSSERPRAARSQPRTVPAGDKAPCDHTRRACRVAHRRHVARHVARPACCGQPVAKSCRCGQSIPRKRPAWSPDRGEDRGVAGARTRLRPPLVAPLLALRRRRLTPETRSASPARGGPLFNRRKWSTFQPALTHHHLDNTTRGAIAYTAGALAHQQRGDHTEAARQLENVRRLRSRLGGACGPTPISRCAALRSASISAILPARSNSRRSRATRYKAVPMPERFQPGRRVSKGGSGEDRTTGSHRPSSGSSLSCRRISRSRRSPIGSISHALPSRRTSRRSTDKLGVPGRSEAVEIIEQFGLGSTGAKVTIPDPNLD